MNDDANEAQFDEDLECRICRGGLEGGALLHPCKCAGSIRYVHEDCIKLWLQRTRAKNCELCHHPFKFSPVYAPDTPSRLPTSTFLLGFLRIFGKHLLLLLRLVCADIEIELIADY
jgi:E3 ubiquitin-protein ligase MARCH6